MVEVRKNYSSAKSTTKESEPTQKHLLASNAILENLKNRKGFSELFDLVDADVYSELRTSIATIIKEKV